jgi:large subunit ribosomal protein L31
MKKDIHPNYGETTITCGCGVVVQTKSTSKAMHVNSCSACHPFYTGRTALVDAKGRVEQFRKRYAKK